jgi:hypothetical protein
VNAGAPLSINPAGAAGMVVLSARAKAPQAAAANAKTHTLFPQWGRPNHQKSDFAPHRFIAAVARNRNSKLVAR